MFDSKILGTKIVGLGDQTSRNIFLKKIVLGVVVLALAFVVAAYVSKLTDPANGYTRVDQAVMLVLAIFWLCSSLISGLVFSPAEFLAVTLIGFTMVFWPFSRHLETWLMVTFMFLGIFLIFFARQAGKSVVENSIKLKANHVLSAGLPKIIFILSLLMSLSFWSVRFSSGFDLKISDVQGVTSGLGIFYPGYNEKTTVGEFAEKLIEKQSSGLLNNLLPSGIPDVFKSGIKQEAEKSLLSQVSDLFGREVSPKETIIDLLHSWVKSYYDNLSENTKRTAGLIVLLIVFAFWLGVFQLFGFVVYIIFWIILELLLLLKLIKVGVVTVEKEVLMI